MGAEYLNQRLVRSLIHAACGRREELEKRGEVVAPCWRGEFRRGWEVLEAEPAEQVRRNETESAVGPSLRTQ